MPQRSVIYLDYAAATPIDERVVAAMQPFLMEDFYNPSATYVAGRQVRQTLETARAEIAACLGAKVSEIIFTAGGTEANNLAIHGVMRRFPQANVVVSTVEHESVLAPAHEYDCREVAVSSDGRIDPEAVSRKIDDKTVLVSIIYANNEIGTVQPIREVAKIINEIRRQRQASGNKLPLLLHSDAAQAANYLDLHVARLGVDLMTLNGGKIYGPKQSGVLYVKSGVELRPLVLGGGQERGLRSGTENVAAVVGFAKALTLAQAMRQEEAARLFKLQQAFLKHLQDTIPKAIINGSLKYRLPNNVHLILPGTDNERLLIEFDEAGILAAAGSACSASDEEPSHVLKAIGLSDAEARASLRFTMGRATDIDTIEAIIQALRHLI